MKRIIITLCVLLAFIITGCKPTEESQERKKLVIHLKTPRKLRTFKVRDRYSKSFSASYFLIFGSASGTSENFQQISFWWEASDNLYVNTKTRMSNIKIKLDDTIKVPYITVLPESVDYFIVTYHYGTIEESISRLCERGVFIIHCSSKDFPISIDMNEL